MNAIELAIKTETDAIDFYTKAAEKTTHLIGKKMFLSIIEDEKRHLKALQALFRGLDITVEDVSPMARMKTVFEENKEFMMERIPASADDTDALKVAMEMEKESVEFYERAAAEVKADKEKALFACLVKQENEHFTIFSNTYNFLTDSGNWFMWKEYAIVDGGTPWA